MVATAVALMFALGAFVRRCARPPRADLQPVPDEVLGGAVHDLQREVEAGPVSRLPALAEQALTLTDMICWASLERGDVARFCRDVDTDVALREFMASANLLL